MSKQLRIAPELALPIEAVTKKFAFFGQNGSGKTYGAMKLAELMLDAGGQIVVVDPVGKWYGLRVAENGKDPSGIEIPVFGGLHGDIPLESTAGELVADVIVDRGISAVLDVSQFDYDAERTRFLEHFARRIFNRKKAAPSAIHIFLEEAQEFLPMQPNAGEEKMLREVLRLGKIGRNHGFGWTLITPRPQEITTKARNLSEVVLAFQTNGTHERKAIAEWVKEKGEDLDVVAQLPKLKPGFAHAWSPSWLEFSGTIHIAKKRTFDASATPVVGAKAIEARPLGSIDLEQLKKTMAATIEKAKADDPKELRKQIATLKAELAKAGKATAPGKPASPDPAVVQAHVNAGVVAAMKGEWQHQRKLKLALESVLKGLSTRIPTAIVNLDNAIGTVRHELEAAIALLHKDPPAQHAVSRWPIVSKTETASRPRPTNLASATATSNGKLAGAKLKIVRALAELETIGVQQAKRAQLSFYSGLSFAGGYGSNTLGAMRTEGLVDYPTDGFVSLTDQGRAAAGEIDPPTSLKELHDRVRRHLSGLELRIFDALVQLGEGGSITRQDLGEQINASFAGGYGSNTLGALRTAGIVTYPSNGSVGPSDLLFPEGLS